jgi:hypothetical protein
MTCSSTCSNICNKNSIVSLCRYQDGPPISLTSSHEKQWNLKASELEIALTRRLALQSEDYLPEEDKDPVKFQTRYDCHWLRCRRPCLPLSTILGIAEDSDGKNSLSMDRSLRVTVFTVPILVPEVNQNPLDNDDASEFCGCACACPAPHLDWKRTATKLASTRVSDLQLQTATPLSVHWVDLRKTGNDKDGNDNPLLTSQAGVLHLLRSLLGTSHVMSPWLAKVDNDCTTQPAVVVVVVRPSQLDSSNNVWTDFRVGDAAPSWFLHSITELDGLEDILSDNSLTMDWWTQRQAPTDAQEATLLVYKRLPPRKWLTPAHPVDTDAIMAPPGCLWETYHEEKPEVEKGGEQNGTVAANALPNEPKYRLQSPPYLNFAEEYPSCRSLLDEENVKIFTEESLNIPRWTPWPETQHYSSTNAGEDGDVKPWTVFPLCHCFPAQQLDNFQWIPLTKAHCPRTCKILQEVLGSTLRTALFSQLAPQTVLQPHTGWADLANHVVRLHIPLVVPGHKDDDSSQTAGLCATWVDGCVETHVQGRALLFDDSKIHRAFNYSNSVRIVLIVDLERPSHLPLGRATGGHSEELDQFIQKMSLT